MARFPRIRRWLVWLGVLIVLFTVIGFFVLPPIIKAQMIKRLSAELGREVTVGRVRVNPYALSLTIEKLAVSERGSTALFIGWEKFYANFELISFFTGEWRFGWIELDAPYGHVIADAGGALNFSDLLAKAQATPSSSEPGRPIHVIRLDVKQAQIEFEDRGRVAPFKTRVGPLTFTVSDFHTVSGPQAPYRFEAVTESGEKFTWQGWIESMPLRSAGELSVEQIVLKKYAPYYADFFQGEIVDGKLSVRGKYEISLEEKKRVLKLTDGTLALRGLKVAERGGKEPIVDLPTFDILGATADALTFKASATRVAIEGGAVHVRRDKAGAINLLGLLPPAKPAEAPSNATPTKPEFDVMVGEISAQALSIELTDLAAPRPAKLGLGQINFSLKQASLAVGAQMPVKLSLDWAPGGTVKIDGAVSLQPMKADLTLALAGVELRPLSPYLEEFVNARLTQGAVSIHGRATLALKEDQPPAATFAGNIAVDKFGLVDGAQLQDLAGWTSLALSDLKAMTGPMSVTLGEVKIVAPYARVRINPDKTINLLAVARGPVTVPLANQPPAPDAALPLVKIGRVLVEDGDFSFSDRSLSPEVRMSVDHVSGILTGLSSEQLAKGQIDLKANVDGSAPVSLAGSIDLLGADKAVDVKITANAVDLLPLSPYSGQFAGYELARGKLRLDIAAKVAARKVNVSNVITLNQFAFGTATNNPLATKLPVRLAVALLKDTDGRIVIDVPVEGNLDDPSFRISKVVWRVIGNLLTKAAVSPFSLLGAAFGGGGEELAYQDFAPGESMLTEEGLGKLETLRKALAGRPALNLDLEGSYDAAADGYALKQLKLERRIRDQIWAARHDKDPNIPPADQLEISAEERSALVKQLFDEKFPPGTEFGTPLPQAPAIVEPPPRPKGFFSRVIRDLTFKTRRERVAAKNENTQRSHDYEKNKEQLIAAGLPPEQMSARLAEVIAITSDDLRELASQRAQRVRDHMLQGGIASDRLFLSKLPESAEAAKMGKGPRVFLQLQ